MKIRKSFLVLLATAAALTATGMVTPQHARADVSVSFFYDSLDPYGEWVQDPDYGYCWHPSNVADDWSPYTDGYWAYTDCGWTWVSYEDYGGIVYHYGRWARVAGEGWVWVPGNTWAPAWVSWRSSDDYVGWAPLPPEARWRAGFGFNSAVDVSFDIGPGYYNFVGVRDFGAPALGAVIVNRDRNVTIINNTTNITNITVNNSNVYVGGPRFDRLAAVSSRPIPTLKVVRQSNVADVRGGKILSRQQGNNLMVLAPRITPTAAGTKLAPSKVAKTLTDAKPDHGWGVVKDPSEAEKLHAQFKQQAGSSANAAAKPVNPDDVKLVDTNIKQRGNRTTTPKNDVATGDTNAGATPAATPKGKGGRTKNEDLLNTPATQEPGTGAPGATPKGKKGKKSRTDTENPTQDTTGAAAATGESTPKSAKGKKTRTPSDFEATNVDGADVSRKHPTQNTDSGLQPFDASGGGSSAGNGKNDSDHPKARRTPREDVQQTPQNTDAGNKAGNGITAEDKPVKEKHATKEDFENTRDSGVPRDTQRLDRGPGAGAGNPGAPQGDKDRKGGKDKKSDKDKDQSQN